MQAQPNCLRGPFRVDKNKLSAGKAEQSSDRVRPCIFCATTDCTKEWHSCRSVVRQAVRLNALHTCFTAIPEHPQVSGIVPAESRIARSRRGARRYCVLRAFAGAGKTSFISVLAARAPYGIMTGSVTINGRYADMSNISPPRMVCFNTYQIPPYTCPALARDEKPGAKAPAHPSGAL